MDKSFKDFVESVEIMLKRNPSATDSEVVSWLNNNGVISEAELILEEAKINVKGDK